MMGWVWAGYDLLVVEVLRAVNWRRPKDDLERELTQLLAPRVRRCMPPGAFCYIEHGPYERETRKPPPAQPPQYDLAFVLFANERVMWPMEAKVLSTDRDTSAYTHDVLNEFLTCRYAPFSEEAAMLGYLLSGDPARAFGKIETQLGVSLIDHSAFRRRNHKVSAHSRQVPQGKTYSATFRCHHLLMPVS
jgi:hypothetical protein